VTTINTRILLTPIFRTPEPCLHSSMFHHHARKTLSLVSTCSCKSKQTQTRIVSLCTDTATCTHSHSNLLTLCSNARSLHQTKQAHASALLNAWLPNSVSLCASLMLSYSTFGDPTTSRCLFEQTVEHCRTAFLWNTLIRANSIAKVYDGFEPYNRMVRTGVRPDDHTFPFVLKACSDFLEVRKGMEIHGIVFKLGFDMDVLLGIPSCCFTVLVGIWEMPRGCLMKYLKGMSYRGIR
jgi:hypothetical protein